MRPHRPNTRPMKKPKKRLRVAEARKLLNRTDISGNPIPFSIKFVTKDGRVDVAENCIKTVSYNRLTGMRRIILFNGDFRNIYDILILQIDDTKIIIN